MADGLDAESGGDMDLAGAGSADKNHIVRAFDKGAAMELLG